MDDADSQNEIPSVKYRLTGAFFWLGLMVVIVPSWYSHPVNFDPDQTSTESKTPSVLIDKPFELPVKKMDSAGNEKDVKTAKPAVNPVETKPVENKQNSTKRTTDSSNPTSVSETQQQVASAKQSVETEVKTASQPVNWVVQLVAYRSKGTADALKERLKYDYDAFVKFFPKNGYYSVRVGPYQDKEVALKDQARLNKLLRIDSILIKGQFKNEND